MVPACESWNFQGFISGILDTFSYMFEKIWMITRGARTILSFSEIKVKCLNFNLIWILTLFYINVSGRSKSKKKNWTLLFFECESIVSKILLFEQDVCLPDSGNECVSVTFGTFFLTPRVTLEHFGHVHRNQLSELYKMIYSVFFSKNF